MAVAFRAVGAGATVAGTTIAPAIPAGTVVGDIVLAFYQANAATTTWTGPTGWNQVGSTLNGSALYWRAFQVGDADPSATASAGATCAVCVSYSGADTLTPFDFGSSLSIAASTTNFNTAAFYNAITDSMFVVFAGAPNGAGKTFTEQVSITEDLDLGNASFPSLMTGHEATTLTAGTQAARTVTLSATTTAAGASWALAIRPAGQANIACDSLTGAADTQLLSTAGTALSFTRTNGVGANSVLLVSLETTIPQTGNPTAATWTPTGGSAQNLTLLDTVHPGTSGNIYLYYLLAPVSGTGAIAFTLQTSSKAVVGAISFANINQTTPFRAGQASGNVAGTTTRFSSTSSGAPTVTVATSSGDWTYDTAAQFATSNALTMTAVTSRIQAYNGNATGGGGTTQSAGAGSIMVAPASSQVLAWTVTAGNVAEIGCALVQATPMKPGIFLRQAVNRAAVY